MPRIHPTVYIDETALIIGDVEIGEESSVWMSAVIRGDVHHIRIGRRSNVQDGTIVHVMKDTHPTIIGDDVTIHPHVVIGGSARDGSTAPGILIVIGDGAQLGAGAKIITSESLEIGKRALIGANAVVLESVPPDCTAVGVPARILPTQKRDDSHEIKKQNP